MKYFLVIFVFLVGCKQNDKYPKFVKNSCTGLWAIQTGFGKDEPEIISPYRDHYLSERKEVNLFLGKQCRVGFGDYAMVDSKFMPAGHENTYSDSSSAVKYWMALIRSEKQQAKLKAELDAKQHSDKERQKKYDDSVFNCQHSYN